MSKIFGLAPFCYGSGKSKDVIQTSVLGTIHSYLMCSTFLVLLAVLCKWNLENEFPKYNLIIDIVNISDSFVSCMGVIVSYILCATVNRGKVQKLLSLVSQVDTCLIKADSYKKIFVSQAVGIFVFFFMHSFCFILCTLSSYRLENHSIHFIYFLFHTVGMITYFQFVYSVLLMKHRFRTLNEDLLAVSGIESEHVLHDMQLLKATSQKMSENGLEGETVCQQSLHGLNTTHNHSEQTSELSDTEDLKRSEKVTTLRIVHSILCDASELTNSIFQFQILVGFIEIFVEITLCLYACLTYVTGLLTCQLYNPSRWNLLGLFLMWASMNFYTLIAITTSCHGTTEEANRTAVLVHKLLVAQSAYPETTAELRLFSLQLLHRKLHFSACGFFPIDFTLLYSMAGSVTTNLVILLQYSGEDVGSLIELCNKPFNKTA